MVQQPLSPGFYTIKNRQNGYINRGDVLGAPRTPIVAALSGAIWYIDRVERDHTIDFTPRRPYEFPNQFLHAHGENESLYASEVTHANLWCIRGYGSYYVIFEADPALKTGIWALNSRHPGHQVDILRFPHGCTGVKTTEEERLLQTIIDSETLSEEIFHQIPDNWLWHIEIAHVPKILWIGCSDARVPESVAKLPNTQIFVQRNIANQFHLTDSNAGAVLTYGLTGIKNDPITEVHIVGHSDCGGVNACHTAANGRDTGIPPSSILWTWLGPLRVLADSYKDRPAIELAKENVRVQARNVKETLRRLGVKRPVAVKGYLYHISGDRLEEVGCV